MVSALPSSNVSPSPPGRRIPSPLLFRDHLSSFFRSKSSPAERPQGNLLQLKEKRPHMTFTKWAETYGPIYSIQVGAVPIVVINSSEVAKEAMVTKFSSISTRKLSNALKILTQNKCMVAMSDHDDFHKTMRRRILTNMLGGSAQKQHQRNRDVMMENLLSQFQELAKKNPFQALNFRNVFEPELFAISMKQALGENVESIYVKELKATLSSADIYRILVVNFMEGAIEVDWRDYFPYLKWVPNMDLETKLRRVHFQRQAVMKALIAQQKKRIAAGEARNSFLDYLLSEESSLTEDEIIMLIWEPIIEAADTTLVSTEWAIFQLAKDQNRQDRLCQEIQSVCGSNKIKEEDLTRLPYLNAVFHETLRKNCPVPVIPQRYVHEDVQLGGYHIPAGTEIAINIYGCNMNKEQWESPEEWKPERFLDEKYDPLDLYKTMAFGAGKRLCAGSLQAMLITCMAVGTLIQEFQWTLKDGEKEDTTTVALTSRKLHPLQAIPKPRRKGN